MNNIPSFQRWLQYLELWPLVSKSMPGLKKAHLWKLPVVELLSLDFNFRPDLNLLSIRNRSRRRVPQIWHGTDTSTWCFDAAGRRRIQDANVRGMKVTPELIQDLHEAIWGWNPQQTVLSGEFFGAQPWRWKNKAAITATLQFAATLPALAHPVRRHYPSIGQVPFITGWAAWQDWRSLQAKYVRVATRECAQVFAGAVPPPRPRNIDTELFMNVYSNPNVSPDKIRTLLKQGADPNVETPLPRPAFTSANFESLPLAATNDPHLIEMLLDAGADPKPVFRWARRVFKCSYWQKDKSITIGLGICRVLHDKNRWQRHHRVARRWLRSCSLRLNRMGVPDHDYYKNRWIQWHRELDRVARLFRVGHIASADATAHLL